MTRLACLLPGLLIPLIASCAQSESNEAPPETPVGEPEQPDTPELSIDEDGIAGDVAEEAVSIDIPVTSEHATQGRLRAFIGKVDGTPVTREHEVDYDLRAGELQPLRFEFDLPLLEEQAELFEYNLFIRDDARLRVARSLLYVVRPYEVWFEGPRTVLDGKPASYRVQARDALTQSPLALRPVTLAVRQRGEVVEELHAETGADGNATFQLELKGTGHYDVTATAKSSETAEHLEQGVAVESLRNKVLLTTDKPVYKPGQTLHLRALALRRGDNTPLSGAQVRFEIEDGKGNKLLQRDLEADEFGIAATKFALGRILNEGSFAVRAIVDGQTSEKTVTVGQYALPKFQVAVSSDRPWYRPGDAVHVSIDARYFFGKAVSFGKVTVELGAEVAGEQLFESVIAETNASGRYQAKLRLPDVLPGLAINGGNALAFVRARVTDTAGQEVERELPLTVASSAVQVSVVPESTLVVPGLENRLLVFVEDPLGGAVENAEVSIEYDGQSLAGTTDASGFLELGYEPTGEVRGAAKVTVEAPGEPAVTQSFRFGVQEGEEHLLLRTDKSVYELGDTVQLEVLTSQDSGFVYVDWSNGGQVVDMETLEVVDGHATSSQTLDSALLGENRIEAYVVDSAGDVVRTGRSVFVRNEGSLAIELSTDKPSYAPGERARLTFEVRDETGAPEVAALGVQIVDEAVFNVIDARPGLLRSYFELEDSFAAPSYQLSAPGGSLSDLFFSATASTDPQKNRAAQSRVEANLAALGAPLATGIRAGSWPQTLARGKQLLEPYYRAQKEAAVSGANAAASRALRYLTDSGCELDANYCEPLGNSTRAAFRERIAAELRVFDFWGKRFSNHVDSSALRLSSPGPDEVRHSDDDAVITIYWSEIDVRLEGSRGADAGVGLDDGDFAVADDDGVESEPDALAEDDDSAEPRPDEEEAPRVRRDFPETLYVNPALITGPDGIASIDLDLADSITQWRVSTLAHTASGRLGGSASGVTVFQDFFVDVDFPATLTRNDELEFPIAIYNYLSEPQTVTLELTAEDWYTPLGATTATVELAPGQVTQASFPVRVERVGRQTLTVNALGTAKSDAVARAVEVVPDGKAFPLAQSGSVGETAVSHTVSFPGDAIEGSPELYLDVYPAFLAQAVAGMDSVLQVPSGCFEQTTSSTWPNVLVTRYMQEMEQITPEIALRAESLISAGYQRLLTFEHQGGGFSWFGERDSAPYLSVTAFGLMEFSDMAKVHEVDSAMLDRTRAWLLGQQARDGSWEGDVSEFFSFHRSELRNTAFVLWALASAGYTGPETALGLDFVRTNLDTEDAYTLALVANAMLSLDAPDAADIVARLEDAKQSQGEQVFWPTGVQTNFYGGGKDADVATTALVTHALLLAGGHAATVSGALDYITSAKDPNGNFGSTQATIWSLRTLLLAASLGTEGAEGTLTVSVDDEVFSTVELTSAQKDVVTTLDLKRYATSGDHEVTLAFEGSGQMSYNLISSHHQPWDAVEEPGPGPLSVEVSYDRERLQVDETLATTVLVTNHTERTQNMVLVTVGVPPGFDVATDDLAPYRAAGVLSRYELTGRQLVFYLDELPGGETLTLEYGMRATLPVRASDGGAEVYPYYEPEQKTSSKATTLEVTAL